MTVIEFLLRAVAALVLGGATSTAGAADSGGAWSLLAVAALGVAAVAAAVVVARVLVAVLAAVLGVGPSSTVAAVVADLVTRITFSHPDADGHTRSRAPGAVAPS
ncbi:DUF6412 domain-containing protein [Curtobacterium sp. PhB115]|uniref:DUF6412 domain-containing protein n=1 Tax=Curtobacterium sp. PhB115 TaxID=2485173 RepID=UPI000F4BDC2A|nr:DUF6412 domain-containing protein [Curtobacterium sp. PhB115]ROP66851.1 hypothetical protein EDF19_2190 [Curtobacterium sp. PhB115]